MIARTFPDHLQSAIVTGASSGIGLSTVKLFIEAGASVLGVDLSPAPPSVPINEQFQFHRVNLAESTAPSSIVTAFRSSFPDQSNIDILVNNAGIMDNNAGVETFKDETYDRVIAVNLTAPIKLMREVVKIMKQNGGGSIINVSSKAGTSGGIAGVAYTASKHGLVSNSSIGGELRKMTKHGMIVGRGYEEHSVALQG